MSKAKNISRHYEHRIDDGRANFDVLDWASAESQRTRFGVLADNIDLTGKSILDVGCGLGDLLTFIERRGIDVKYTGVDILEKMVIAARDQHGEATFLRADVFGADPFAGEKFDLVFCSGTFNLNLGNNRSFLPVAIAALLEYSCQYVVFNLLKTNTPHQDRTYFYHNPDDVRKMLAPLPCDTQIIEGYLPNDFTVICRRKD